MSNIVDPADLASSARRLIDHMIDTMSPDAVLSTLERQEETVARLRQRAVDLGLIEPPAEPKATDRVAEALDAAAKTLEVAQRACEAADLPHVAARWVDLAHAADHTNHAVRKES